MDNDNFDESWPQVEWGGVLSTFANVEKQIEILKSLYQKNTRLIIELQNNNIDNNNNDNKEPSGLTSNEKTDIYNKFEDHSKKIDAYYKKLEAINARVESCEISETSSMTEIKKIADKLLHTENDIHEFQRASRNQFSIYEKNFELLSIKVEKLDQLQSLPEEFNSFKVDYLELKEELNVLNETMKSKFNKYESDHNKLHNSLDLLSLKTDQIEGEVNKITRTIKTFREEINMLKEKQDKNTEAISELTEKKADVEDLFRKADKTSLNSKADKEQITIIEDAINGLTRRINHAETSMHQGFDRAEKSSDKKLEDIVQVMVRIVRKEVKKAFSQSESFSDIGKAGVSKNRCLVCDQVVKVMERESPAHLPELPHTQGLLHLDKPLKTRTFKPDARHEESPPRAHFDQNLLRETTTMTTTHNIENQETSFGIVLGPVEEKTPVVTEEKISKDPKLSKKIRIETVGINKSLLDKSEKTGYTSKGIVFDVNTNNDFQEREFVSVSVTGKQVRVADVVSAHNSGAKLIDVIRYQYQFVK